MTEKIKPYIRHTMRNNVCFVEFIDPDNTLWFWHVGCICASWKDPITAEESLFKMMWDLKKEMNSTEIKAILIPFCANKDYKERLLWKLKWEGEFAKHYLSKSILDDDLFYVISYKHTNKYYLCFWWPNNAGYTEDLKYAGKYTRKQIEGNSKYYNDWVDSVAIPCEELEKEFRIIQHVEQNRSSIYHKKSQKW